jgi:hypothetical protein
MVRQYIPDYALRKKPGFRGSSNLAQKSNGLAAAKRQKKRRELESGWILSYRRPFPSPARRVNLVIGLIIRKCNSSRFPAWRRPLSRDRLFRWNFYSVPLAVSKGHILKVKLFKVFW